MGVYVGPRGPLGADVVHSDKESGRVVLVHFATFAAGQTVVVQSAQRGSWFEQKAIASRALSLLGQEFDLLNLNCEHLVSFAQTGRPESPQLKLGVGLAALAVAAAFALASSRK